MPRLVPLRILVGSALLGIVAVSHHHSAPPEPAPAPPDLVLHGGRVIVVDPPGGRAEAVAVRGNRILFVGSSAAALALRGPATRVVDLQGRTVIPGLIDAHGHVASLGLSLGQIDAVGARSAAEVIAKVAAAAGAAPPDRWIVGRGWDQNDWKGGAFPTAKDLDAAAPSNPVALRRVDGHALWVNSRALAMAGITRESPDPDGGRIHRGADGVPSGILVDNAMTLVNARIPPPDREATRRAILDALNRCLDAGLTGVHDAGVDDEVDVYRELAEARRLPIRVYAMLAQGNAGALLDAAAGSTAAPGGTWPAGPDGRPRIGLGGGFFTLRAIKMYVDGALGSRGAALFEDYTDEPGRRGLLVQSPERITDLAVKAARAGWQVCVHAIGDRGNRLVLDAFAEARKAAPGADLRFRVEHAQVLSGEDMPRFAALGAIASMQPTHCTSDMPWAEARLGPARIQGAYAWRSLLDAGATLAAGSDFPVESENPFLGLYAAMTRQDAAGRPAGGWRAAERMTPEEALRAFTIGAAYAAFQENDLGAITAGRLADLLVLPADPLEPPRSRLLTMKPDAVILDGRVVRAGPSLRAALGGGEP